MAAARDTRVIELLSDDDEASIGAHATAAARESGAAAAVHAAPLTGDATDAAQDKADGGGVAVVRFAASKVAVVVGLHEFGDPVEEFLEYLYQDHEELLERDAEKLQLRVVSKDAELDALVAKTGAGVAPRLREILSWTSDRNAPPAQLAKAQQLLRNVDSLLNDPKTKRRLGTDDIEDARRMLKQKIHHSVGVRNENLALASYEKQHGCAVRLTNEHFYFLVFPRPPPVTALSTTSFISAGETPTNGDTFARLDRMIERFEAPKWSKRSDFEDADDENDESGTSWRLLRGYFSICGMVDGVTDTVMISDDDDWALMPIVVEVKNRMRAFRDPPPLHDQIQMAVYMKMLDLEHGDLVQCLNTDRASIKVSRISLNAYPLSYSASSSNEGGTSESRDLWTSMILPRLYQFTRAVHRVRHNELLRLAFLNGSPSERLEMLRRECEYL